MMTTNANSPSRSHSNNPTPTRKRKHGNGSETAAETKRQHIGGIDHTRTCAVDVLLHITTFMGDKNARSFAHTSKSNLSALRRYQYERPLDVVKLLIKYRRLIESSSNNTGRSLFHPRCAFGQWNSIAIDCSLVQSLHPRRSKRSNKPLVNFIDDYIQSREMMKLNSTSQSLRLKSVVSHSSLPTFKWLMKLFRIRPYELIWHYSFDGDSASDRDLLRLRDIIPHWNEIQVLNTSGATIKNPAESISPFPSSLTHLRILYLSDDMARIILPSNLKKFEFACDREQSCDKWPQMPSTLETLILNGYAQSLKNYDLPSSLTHLQIDCHTRQLDKSVFSLKECQLPSTLKFLKLADQWNLPVEELGELPNSLETLEFGEKFDQPVDRLKLPPSLKSLIFGLKFNHSIDSLILPQSLTHLSFVLLFNQPIRGDIFPPQLKSLTLSPIFNQPIDEWKLPHSLTHIKFGYEFDQPIHDLPINFWPTSLVSFDWYQFPIKWVQSTSTSTRVTPLISNSSFIRNDMSIIDGSHIDDSSHIHDDSSHIHIPPQTLKPIFDRTSRRQELCTYGRRGLIEMLKLIRQAKLNELE